MSLIRVVCRRTRWGLQAVRDLAAYGWWTGRWWLPMMVLVLIGLVWIIATAQIVVPTAVYTLF